MDSSPRRRQQVRVHRFLQVPARGPQGVRIPARGVPRVPNEAPQRARRFLTAAAHLERLGRSKRPHPVHVWRRRVAHVVLTLVLTVVTAAVVVVLFLLLLLLLLLLL